jgi:hypothetical protein
MGIYITTPQLKARLRKQLQPYWVPDTRPRYAGFSDSRYYAPTGDEIKKFLSDTPLQPTGAFGEVFDCDDYAFVMKGAASLYARDVSKLECGLCIGIAWARFSWKPDPFHACNWTFDNEGQVWWVEPQDHQLHALTTCKGDLTLIII